MPSRILREGILSSERIAVLGWPEEVFYRRLMSVVDDFGRYYAHPSLLHAALYPLQLNKVSDSDIGKWLTSCVNAALVRVYPASDGKRYLEVLDFRQQVRAKESKFPGFDPQLQGGPPADVAHVRSKRVADAPVFVFGDGDGDDRPSASSARTPTIPCPYTQIVALYREKLPSLPGVKLMDEERKRALRKFWGWVLSSEKTDGSRRATTADEALSWIGDYFARASENDWLMGRGDRTGKHAKWRANLDFLLTDKGKKHVIERTFDDEAVA